MGSPHIVGIAGALAGIGMLLSSHWADIKSAPSGTTSAAGANFAGTWAVSGLLGNPAFVTVTPDCTFQQDGDKISGTCEGPGAKGSVDGVVDGSTIVWNWHMVAKTPRGLAGVATFKAVLGSDGIMTGTWTHSAVDGVGKFTPATSSAPAM
jgi:hypothetical protein